MEKMFSKIFFLIIIAFSNCLRISKPIDRAPDISLVLWVGGDLHGRVKDYIQTASQVSHDLADEAPVTLVNDTIYALTSEVSLIGFVCKSKYPIQWTFSNSKFLLFQEKTFGMYLTASRRISGMNLGDPSSFEYWSQLFLLGDSRMYVGNYSCHAPFEDYSSNSHDNHNHDYKLTSNITLFWEGGPFDQIFPLSQKNITVRIDADDRVIFPCYVNNPLVQPILKIEDATVDPQSTNETASWVKVDKARWEWRPEAGFIYVRDSINDPDNPYPTGGNYKCAIENEDHSQEIETILISFDPRAETSIFSNLLDQKITTNATLRFDRTHRRYECCSSSANPPTLFIHSCGDPGTCIDLDHAIEKQLEQYYGDPSKMTSAFNNIYSKELMRFFNSKNGSCSYHQPFGWKQAEMDYVECFGDGIQAIRNYMPREEKDIDFFHPKYEDMVKIRPNFMMNTYRVKAQTGKNDTFEVYLGSTVGFQCLANFYYFSHGIRFSILKNGKTEEVLPDTFDTAAFQKNAIGDEKILFLIHNPPLKGLVTLTVTEDLKELRCHVPITQTTGWADKTIFFNIKRPRSPEISVQVDGEEPSPTNPYTVTWTLNDTERSIACKTTGGDPEAVLMWTKDGKSYYNVSVPQGQGGFHVIKIPKVTHDVQGEYKCTAVNFKGTVERVFIVTAQEPSSSHGTIAIIMTVVILAILGVVGAIVWRTVGQRKVLKSLKEEVDSEGDVNG